MKAASFGSNSTGKTHLTPLGECIVLGPDGSNVDVAAHEFVHAETWYRVGWVNHLLSVPTWFNEGVALIVDYRDPFLVENIKLQQDAVDEVKSKVYGFEFFDGENEGEHYLASRLAVDKIDHSVFYEKLAEMSSGKKFSEVFAL